MSDFFPSWFSIPLLPASLWLPTAALAAVLLDRFLGELPRFHPLVGFGAFVDLLEKLLNPSPQRRQCAGKPLHWPARLGDGGAAVGGAGSLADLATQDAD